MALFLFSLLFILTPKVAERRISMSAIIFLPGRPTTDPQIMQAKNSNTTYTTLDISCPQRGADGKQRDRILFLLFQFISGRPPDQSRSKKVNRSDYHWRAGAASLHSSEREKPGETELRPQRGCQRLAVCTYDL